VQPQDHGGPDGVPAELCAEEGGLKAEPSGAEHRLADYVGFIRIALLLAIIWGVSQLPAAKTQWQLQITSDPLVQALRDLPLPAFAIPAPVRDCSYSAKGWIQRHYECYYDTNAGIDEIQAFYAHELQARDWQRLGGVGPLEAVWCRKGDLALLQVQKSLQAGYSYTLTMSRSSFRPNCATP
jgi:hypothetical protein